MILQVLGATAGAVLDAIDEQDEARLAREARADPRPGDNKAEQNDRGEEFEDRGEDDSPPRPRAPNAPSATPRPRRDGVESSADRRDNLLAHRGVRQPPSPGVEIVEHIFRLVGAGDHGGDSRVR